MHLPNGVRYRSSATIEAVVAVEISVYSRVPICVAVDFITGDALELKPDPVSVTLIPAPSAVAPAPAAPTEVPTRGTTPPQ